jgi:hypothetical protein
MDKPSGMHRWTASTALGLSLALAGASETVQATEEEIEFSVAELFFELNDTDGDLGFHGKVDGEPWRQVTIENPSERLLMTIQNRGSLRQQGLTEFSFESAEPPFDELPPEAVFGRFPEGTYEIEGRGLDGMELESEVEVSHVMPAPAVATVNGEPMATQCDPDEPGYDAPAVSAPVTIAWVPVTGSHPSVGTPGMPVEIQHYEIVAESKIDVNGEEFESKFGTILPPTETEITIPPQYLALAATFKYEVLARSTNGNRTAVESCFLVE